MLQSNKPIQNIEELREHLHNLISTVDLSQHLPPYLSTYYHPIRKTLYQNYAPLHQGDTLERNQNLYKFIQVVDEEMLTIFQMQLSKPYQDLILVKHYGIPQDMDVEKLKNDNQTMLALTTMVSSIAEWNIQIERTVDSIARVQLYQLWHPDQKLKETQMNAEIKALLSPQNDFNFQVFTKHIMINMLSYGAEKFSKFLYTTGIAQSNLSFGAVLLIYHALVGGAALPWKVLLPQVQVQWLFGGVIGSLALGKIANYLDKFDQMEQIYGCAGVFDEITTLLVEFNENLTITINQCLLTISVEEDKLKRQALKETIENFLKSPDSIKEEGVEMITAEDIIKHERDDWQIIK